MSGIDEFQTGQHDAHQPELQAAPEQQAAPELQEAKPAEPARKKPRLVLMGEFSAGKSTLSNILLSGTKLPTQVTATRLPPVHVSLGAPSAWAMTHDGERIEVDLDDLSGLTPDNVKSIHLTAQADTLELCDLVDMPGISDPNMAADTWDEVLTPNDHVVWCTHATQAWRQSEAALWGRICGQTSGANLLVITQFDKLRTPRDQARVLSRVQKEVDGLFSAVYPVSLLDALAAGEDFEAWRACGAHDFMEHLIDILLNGANPAERSIGATVTRESRFKGLQPAAPDAAVLRPAFDTPSAEAPRARHEPEARPAAPAASPAPAAGVKIIPRRVKAKEGGSSRPRPARGDVGSLTAPPGPGGV